MTSNIKTSSFWYNLYYNTHESRVEPQIHSGVVAGVSRYEIVPGRQLRYLRQTDSCRKGVGQGGMKDGEGFTKEHSCTAHGHRPQYGDWLGEGAWVVVGKEKKQEQL